MLTSNMSPHKDVAGGGALTVDPLDVQAIREGFQSLLEDSKLREKLVRRGFENVTQFSAEAVAEKKVEIVDTWVNYQKKIWLIKSDFDSEIFTE